MKKKLTSVNSNSFSKQIISLVKVYVPVILLFFLICWIHVTSNISGYELTVDPNELGHMPPYTGMVSYFGLFLLCGTASTCFFSSYLIDTNNKQDEKWKLFFQCSGCLILLLLIDDAFQIHENFSTLLYGADANISLTNRKLQDILEATVFAIYGSLFFFYGLYFRKLLFSSEVLTLLLAFVFFSLSIIFDMLLGNMRGQFIFEEAFKLLGIVSLMTYYVRVCHQKVNSDLP